MKGAKVTRGKVPAKGSSKKSKKSGNAKETKDKGSVKTNSTSAAENSVEAKSRKSKTASLTNSSTSADQTAADERRLRKLKVYLKSVSYNGCEGTILPNLNDLYVDQLLVDDFPCNELSKPEEFKCNPTPFVIASCFNRTQATDNSKIRGNKGTRRTPRNQNVTPRKRNTQKKTDFTSSRQQDSPLKHCSPFMLSQMKTISAAIASPVNITINGKGKKIEQSKPQKEEKESKEQKESPAKQEEKEAVKDKK